MIWTPEEEEQRARIRKQIMARRKRQVFVMKLSIVGGTCLTILFIILFMTGTGKDSHIPTGSTEVGGNTASSSGFSRTGAKQGNDTNDTLSRKETEQTEPLSEGLQQEEEVSITVTDADTPYAAALNALAREEPKAKTLLSHLSDYPEELQKMAAENAETLDFVLAYPEKKNSPADETIGQVEKGTVPLLIQWDSRWGYAPYGSSIVGASGCGPTCIAMVAAGLTGRSDITPAAVAAYSMENGFLTEEMDTTWDLMTYGCEAFGITGTVLGLSEDTMAQKLQAGSPIICSMRPGDFTNGGHFIVLTGYLDGQFQVHDPNSEIRSSQLWDFETLRGQIKNLWSYQLL